MNFNFILYFVHAEIYYVLQSYENNKNGSMYYIVDEVDNFFKSNIRINFIIIFITYYYFCFKYIKF